MWKKPFSIFEKATRSPRGDQTLTSPLDYAPPYELFKFYQEKTSPTSYQALRVPVESFIPLVQGTPTEDELQRLYKDREKYEPDPSKEEPGFYEPRKVKVEWLSVTGEEPYYKKAAADWLNMTEELAKSEIRGLMVPRAEKGVEVRQGTPNPLAVLAAGTANVWAREIGLPRHPAAVARVLDQGDVHEIDLGVVNGHCFLLMASAGVDSIVVANIQPWAKRTFGKAAYVTQGLRDAAFYPAVPSVVNVDGEILHVDSGYHVVGMKAVDAPDIAAVTAREGAAG